MGRSLRLSKSNLTDGTRPFSGTAAPPGVCLLVRAEGLEPPRLASPEPKSGASTSFATPAGRRGAGRGPVGWGGVYITEGAPATRNSRPGLQRPPGSPPAAFTSLNQSYD